jgi:hypothetical protein
MKKSLLLALLLYMKLASAQFVPIPDPDFRTYIDTAYPGAIVGGMLDTTFPAVVNTDHLFLSEHWISNFEGIQYFKNILYLDIDFNYRFLIDSLDILLPKIPEKVTSFYCDFCGVRNLPPLPSGLRTFYYQSNKASTLPQHMLPYGLYELSLSNNLLTTLPDLPPTLHLLYISGNRFVSLPVMPDSVEIIEIENNRLTSLPPLPAQLFSLSAYSNRLTSLPALPAHLQILDLHDNPLNCVPRLPYNMSFLYLKNTNVRCLPNFIIPTATIDTPVTRCPNNTSACDVNPYVQGRVYLDQNKNGVFDTGEPLLPEFIVRVNPSGWVGGTDSSGEYLVKLDTTKINTWSCATRPYTQVTPPSYSLNPGSQLGLVSGTYNFGISYPDNIYDLQSYLTSMPARPGFSTMLLLSVQNAAFTTQENVTVKLRLPQGVTFSSAWENPTSISGDTLIWTGLRIDSMQRYDMHVTVMVNVNDSLGTLLQTEMLAMGTKGDTTPADNYTRWVEPVRGSFDPNDKLVNRDFVEQGFQPDSVVFVYTVRFQNTGTAAADFVMIRDTISPKLDISTLQVVNASHSYEFTVREHNIVEFYFPNIQLPDSNTSEPLSHGAIQYSIMAKAGLPPTIIENRASIFFDFNAPVVTNTALTVIILSDGIRQNRPLDFLLYPNPASESIHIELKREGSGVWMLSDLCGKLIRTQGLPENGRSFDIGLTDISPGIYFLTLKEGETVSTAKILIQR